MAELEEIILKKISVYKMLYIVAYETGKKQDVKYYSKCLKKLNKILKIL
ncbi:hypothetical protein SAMN05192545_2882 [Maribacter dokdonensis]|uniref:Uncharacterized protein n=1 Tax=Maribacter dokdonensis TaxID=320912 RepID=A0ABY0UTB5_9FLAO|nr:hypothetical protein [Maribacter dokdonensis]SDT15118.1 hypothetical protein SAMN05192545_2882 [Maribacter dokdonensis]